MGYTASFLYILEQFCVGYVNYRGKSFCVGVRYFTVAFPIYRSNFAWGTQNRKGTQNYFYVVYPMQHDHQCFVLYGISIQTGVYIYIYIYIYIYYKYNHDISLM